MQEPEEISKYKNGLFSELQLDSCFNVTTIGSEIRTAIERDKQEGLQLADRIVGCVKALKHVQGDLNSAEAPFAKQVLLEIIDIFASYRINDRQFVRKVLQVIFPISRFIDRSIILFEEAENTPSNVDFSKISDKFFYILQNVAGWKISPDCDPWNTADIDSTVTCYLDLPFQRAEQDKGTCTILTEALYGIQHPDVLLGVLRHTTQPNAFYLWPVILSADLKIIENQGDLTPEEAADEELQIVKLFCRAHQGFQRILVGPESSKSQRGLFNENWLMMPASTAFMVPDDWSSSPCPLAHYCRLVIRSQLHETDNLPLGILQLPIPTALKRYIDLEH